SRSLFNKNILSVLSKQKPPLKRPFSILTSKSSLENTSIRSFMMVSFCGSFSFFGAFFIICLAISCFRLLLGHLLRDMYIHRSVLSFFFFLLQAARVIFSMAVQLR